MNIWSDKIRWFKEILRKYYKNAKNLNFIVFSSEAIFFGDKLSKVTSFFL
jgi:hypothetical protein